MTALLIDTQTVIWAMLQPENVPLSVTALLGEPTIRTMVSIVSPWEMAIKIGTGKLDLSLSIGDLMDFVVSDLQANVLDIEARHIQHLLALPMHHRDPFDRMLIAQAIAEDAMIVTSDRVFEHYPVQVTW